MKWDVKRYGGSGSYYVRWKDKTVYVGEREQCEKIAAAHNAVIDMAFDSPGNVS